jgi:hypothetical protein
LLLLASVGLFFQPAELLVAWGDDGSLPAVCYSSCPFPGSRQFTVLCPGGSNAASQLLHALDKRGCGRLESIFSSMAAPAPRGIRTLLKKKPTAGLILFADTRRRTSVGELSAEARSAGIAVREWSPASGIESSRHQHWKYCSKREKNGDVHWSFQHLKDQVEITLSWQKNGLFEVQCRDRRGNRISRQFPRSNRCGTWRCRLGGRVQGAGCRGQGAGCRVQGAGCRVQGAGGRGRGQGAGGRVQGAGGRGQSRVRVPSVSRPCPVRVPSV